MHCTQHTMDAQNWKRGVTYVTGVYQTTGYITFESLNKIQNTEQLVVTRYNGLSLRSIDNWQDLRQYSSPFNDSFLSSTELRLGEIENEVTKVKAFWWLDYFLALSRF
jgi:hypothetical protein